jgi:hypothetical protein
VRSAWCHRQQHRHIGTGTHAQRIYKSRFGTRPSVCDSAEQPRRCPLSPPARFDRIRCMRGLSDTQAIGRAHVTCIKIRRSDRGAQPLSIRCGMWREGVCNLATGPHHLFSPAAHRDRSAAYTMTRGEYFHLCVWHFRTSSTGCGTGYQFRVLLATNEQVALSPQEPLSTRRLLPFQAVRLSSRLLYEDELLRDALPRGQLL